MRQQNISQRLCGWNAGRKQPPCKKISQCLEQSLLFQFIFITQFNFSNCVSVQGYDRLWR